MKSFIQSIALIAAAALFAAGCAQKPLIKETASGAPEGVFRAATLDDVRSKIIEGCTNKKLTVEDVSANHVVCSRTRTGTDGVMYQAVMGNAYSSAPQQKIRFVMFTSGADVKVTATMWTEMQSAFGQTQRNEAKGADAVNDVQNFLFALGAI